VLELPETPVLSATKKQADPKPTGNPTDIAQLIDPSLKQRRA
jgi:hypothetical protein